MTKAQTAVFNHLVAADKELRLAMIRAGNMALRGNVQMHRVLIRYVMPSLNLMMP